ncbi:hypothetical protein PCANC_08916 [Puccinia coronata f. sp. avenae]|uniref:Uncharacterized protein n=1 Tax=Puccinia coronata f. sp. avenae TaxID=200324 RepID=A0A2N5T2E3_9BASI|nr:hypothetical protein PCANC_08916 [Puccinia coronata f. sp. avenae]
MADLGISLDGFTSRSPGRPRDEKRAAHLSLCVTAELDVTETPAEPELVSNMQLVASIYVRSEVAQKQEDTTGAGWFFTLITIGIYYSAYLDCYPDNCKNLTFGRSEHFQMIRYLILQHACAFLLLSRGAITQLSGSAQSVASTNHTSLPNADIHAGVSQTFNVALHDPIIALSTSGLDIGVTCPAAVRWNEQYARNLTREGPTDEEREQEWIVSYMNSHPDQTLWELFTKTLDDDIQKWIHGPIPIEKAADAVVDATAEIISEFIKMVWAAFKWIVKFPFEFNKEWKQVKNLGTELWDGSKIAAHLFAENPINGLKTITGGLFLHLLLHPAEFTAESILLVGAGFTVIHWFIHGVERIAGALPAAVETALKAVLWFIHSLDDPLLILTPIFTSTAQVLQAGKDSVALGGSSSEENGGFTSDDGAKTVTLPAETVLPAAKQCPLLPPDLGAPPLTYASLCLSSDPSRVREIIFGITKPSNELNPEERVEAFQHVQKFWCCYGDNGSNSFPLPDSILEDVPGREQWEGKKYWRTLDIDCQKIFKENPRPSGGRLTISL